MQEWSEDSNVDGTEIQLEALKISSLHGKYLNIMSFHRHFARKMEIDYKNMKGVREDYYKGHLTKEECDERQWEYNQHRYTIQEITRKLETDPILNNLLMKRIAHEEIVSYCESVLRSLNNRTWDIGNYIKAIQLSSGK